MNAINRIILVGNGFDLAHGLATRYADFINWYWEKYLNHLRLNGGFAITKSALSVGCKSFKNVS